MSDTDYIKSFDTYWDLWDFIKHHYPDPQEFRSQMRKAREDWLLYGDQKWEKKPLDSKSLAPLVIKL